MELGKITICMCGSDITERTYNTKSGDKRYYPKYCSRSCAYKHRVRPSGLEYKIVNENTAWFKKGHVPWSVGVVGTGILKANSGSFKKGEHASVLTEFTSNTTSDSKNINWKADMVGYGALHLWIKRKIGSLTACEECGTNKKLQLANKSRTYKRDIKDWKVLCYRCHRKFDTGHWGAVKARFI